VEATDIVEKENVHLPGQGKKRSLDSAAGKAQRAVVPRLSSKAKLGPRGSFTGGSSTIYGPMFSAIERPQAGTLTGSSLNSAV